MYANAQLRKGPQSNKVAVAAAVSGGGHRAANFGVGVLIGLERLQVSENSNALMEIDYLSTVSGGGFAAGSFVSTFYDHLRSDPSKTQEQLINDFRYEAYYGSTSQDSVESDHLDQVCGGRCETATKTPICIKRNLERGYSESIIAALYTPKTWFSSLDRGDLLEEKVESKLLAACWREENHSITLGDIFKPVGIDPVLPMWITNSTVYENGSIFPFTPDMASKYKMVGFTHNVKRYCIGRDVENCIRIPGYFQIPVAVGVKASASFPGGVAATTFESTFDKNNRYVHLLDGGIADNLGINTAIEMLNSDQSENKVLLVIDSFKESYEPFSNSQGSPKIPQVLSKLFTLPLNSWRGRHMRYIDGLVGENILVVYLNFDSVTTPVDDQARRECPYSKGEIVAMAKKAKTEFNLTKKEQHQLFCAGLFAVAAQEDTILTALRNGRESRTE